MLFMKMAQARENRKDNKGFSLVELIIVIAIMVALVAMLAPQFVKYVSKSREATLQTAAEDVLSVAKSEYALGNIDGSGTIFVGRNEKLTSGTKNSTVTNNTQINIAMDGLTFGEEYDDVDGFAAVCGLDAKSTSSDTVWKITITANSGSTEGASFVITKS